MEEEVHFVFIKYVTFSEHDEQSQMIVHRKMDIYSACRTKLVGTLPEKRVRIECNFNPFEKDSGFLLYATSKKDFKDGTCTISHENLIGFYDTKENAEKFKEMFLADPKELKKIILSFNTHEDRGNIKDLLIKRLAIKEI